MLIDDLLTSDNFPEVVDIPDVVTDEEIADMIGEYCDEK